MLLRSLLRDYWTILTAAVNECKGGSGGEERSYKGSNDQGTRSEQEMPDLM